MMVAMIARFLAREIDVLYVGIDGATSASIPPSSKLLVIPGSFNPLHAGHVRLASAAREMCKRRYGLDADVVFEMSMANADKGEIDGATAAERLRQFAVAEEAVVLTRTPLYVDKAAVVGPCDFVVGADTAIRILDPKYYEDGVEATLDRIKERGCGFVVAGRLDENSGLYVAADDLLLANAPARHRDTFATLTESDFRCDISSTQLRQADDFVRETYLSTLKKSS